MNGERRPAIDVARILALVVVVAGHLMLAVVDRPNGELRAANLLELYPGWEWLAFASPMPVFFAAAGWANAKAWPETAAPRLRALAGLGAVVVFGWSAVLVATVVAQGEPGIVAAGARIATQPLWFVAAYVPFAAFGAWIASLAARHMMALVALCLVVLAALDIARFAYDGPGWLGWPGFYLAWGVPWIMGAWWRSRSRSPRWRERRVGVAVAGAAGIACVVLVTFAGYNAALIDVAEDARSNTNPPTLFTAVAGLAQFGVLLIVAGGLDWMGRRWRALWAWVGEAAVGVYVWHLSALVLCVAVVAAGFPVPERLTIGWWVTRPLWWAAVLAVTAGLAVLTARARGWLRAMRPERRPLTRPHAIAAVVVSAAAGAYVGLEGPTSVTKAVLSSVLFAGGWVLLRGRRAVTPSRPRAPTG